MMGFSLINTPNNPKFNNGSLQSQKKQCPIAKISSMNRKSRSLFSRLYFDFDDDDNSFDLFLRDLIDIVLDIECEDSE